MRAIVRSRWAVVKMAAPRYPYWIEEQSSTHRGPTGAGVLRLALVLVLVALALQAVSAAERGGQVVDVDRGSLCDQHHGRPGWEAVCDGR
jgi:hypothetical protein